MKKADEQHYHQNLFNNDYAYGEVKESAQEKCPLCDSLLEQSEDEEFSINQCPCGYVNNKPKIPLRLERGARTTTAQPNKDHASTELKLFMENDEDFVNKVIEPTKRMLQKKVDKGIFDLERSVEAWLHVVEKGVHQYLIEFCSPTDRMQDVFNKGTRKSLAEELAHKYNPQQQEQEVTAVEEIEDKACHCGHTRDEHTDSGSHCEVEGCSCNGFDVALEKESLRKSLRDLLIEAYEDSKNGYVQHVEKTEGGGYGISDWYDSDNTVASFENGKELMNSTGISVIARIQAADESLYNELVEKIENEIKNTESMSYFKVMNPLKQLFSAFGKELTNQVIDQLGLEDYGVKKVSSVTDLDRWLLIEAEMGDLTQCSHCQEIFPKDESICPSCGARKTGESVKMKKKQAGAIVDIDPETNKWYWLSDSPSGEQSKGGFETEEEAQKDMKKFMKHVFGHSKQADIIKAFIPGDWVAFEEAQESLYTLLGEINEFLAETGENNSAYVEADEIMVDGEYGAQIVVDAVFKKPADKAKVKERLQEIGFKITEDKKISYTLPLPDRYSEMGKKIGVSPEEEAAKAVWESLDDKGRKEQLSNIGVMKLEVSKKDWIALPPITRQRLTEELKGKPKPVEKGKQYQVRRPDGFHTYTVTDIRGNLIEFMDELERKFTAPKATIEKGLETGQVKEDYKNQVAGEFCHNGCKKVMVRMAYEDESILAMQCPACKDTRSKYVSWKTRTNKI